MIANFSVTNSAAKQHQAYQHLIKGEYAKATSLYERAIEAEPEVKSHYWHLGLVLLLLGHEQEAHTTWLLGMVEGDSELVECWTWDLVQVLQTEAERRQTLGEDSVAWLIRQHIREIAPTNINNLLHLVKLAIEQETLTAEELTAWGVFEQLQAERGAIVDSDLLVQVLEKLLEFAPLHPSSLKFAETCRPHLHQNPACVNVLMQAAVKLAHWMNRPGIAIYLAELCLSLDVKNLTGKFWGDLADFYCMGGSYSKGIEAAKRYYSMGEELPEKVYANFLVMKGLLGAGGYWEEAKSALQQQESMLLSLVKQPLTELNETVASFLLTSTFFFPYLRDEPQQNRHIQNKVAHLLQSCFQGSGGEQGDIYNQRSIGGGRRIGTATRPLKIGYISTCLRAHSVGWLARWIFHYHDCERFKVHGYFINSKQDDDALQKWYGSQVWKGHNLEANSGEIAKQIERDEIDILIDLDSLTAGTTFEVMALKPAPVQVTWLGWDASGIPAVDYFIADPYVLPEEAGDYYTEKIWRLPQTYIAVDGFEVGIPTLRRDKLEIPSDAVVYYSAQVGHKRHPDTARRQMQIIKEVPNSYFLIKSRGEGEAVKNFFTQLAEEEGVAGDRLRFLPPAPSEAVHRANLGIADVVLDTYPYNGATTTLETLWMGVPLVTRVGKQFAARNSYTMMVNAGITEGIAWTDEEYVEWGIRLGLDPKLRQEISGRLRRGRQTAPVWNARQFTREMEKAYEQMWANYMENKN